MAVTNTATNGALNVYDDGDNPGAGTKGTTVQAGGTGLNANFETLDKLFTEHTTAGAHKDDVIGGNAIKQAFADGSTLEMSAATGAKTIRIKDLGVTTGKLANNAVTTAKLATDSVDSTILKDDAVTDSNRAVTTDHIRDNAITTGKIGAGAVTFAKLTSGLLYIPLYGESLKAGTASGNAAAAFTEWREDTATYVTKVRFQFLRNDGNWNSIKVFGRAKATAIGTWQVKIVATSQSGTAVSATTSGSNTAYSSTIPELGSGTLSLNISTLPNPALITVELQLASYLAIEACYFKELSVVLTN